MQYYTIRSLYVLNDSILDFFRNQTSDKHIHVDATRLNIDITLYAR